MRLPRPGTVPHDEISAGVEVGNAGDVNTMRGTCPVLPSRMLTYGRSTGSNIGMFADLRQFTKLGADFVAQIGGGVDGGHEDGSWLGSATKVAINNSTTESQEVGLFLLPHPLRIPTISANTEVS